MAMSPADCSIHAILRGRCETSPDRLWLQDLTGDQATYAQARQRGARWAAALRTLDVRPGDRVSSMLTNSVEGVTCWLGITALRAFEAPVHPEHRGPLLRHAIDTVESAVLVIDYQFLPRLAEAGRELRHLKHVVVVGLAASAQEQWQRPAGPFELWSAEGLLASAAGVTADPAWPWDLAAIIYTSGTTGPSKPVKMPWAQLAASSARTFPEGLNESDCFYAPWVASHMGAKMFPYLAATLGARLVLRQGLKMPSLLDEIRQYGVTTMTLFGVVVRWMLAASPRPDDAEIPLRYAVISPGMPELGEFSRRFGVRIATCYSMTEICVPVATEGWHLADWRSVGKYKPGSPGLEVRIVDEHDYPVEPGTAGELIVRSAEPWSLNLGYYGMPEASLEAWRNGWFHTGDIFTVDADGSYYFVDRVKDSIRRRGENISSLEVEAVVCSHPDVMQCAAIAVPSELTEDEIKVCIVRRPGSVLSASDLARYLADCMPRYMIPRYIEWVSGLPLTAGTERVRKAVLRENWRTPRTWDRLAERTLCAGTKER